MKYEIRLLTPWLVSKAASAGDIVSQGDWKSFQIAAPAGTRGHPDRAGYVRWTVAVAVKPK